MYVCPNGMNLTAGLCVTICDTTCTCNTETFIIDNLGKRSTCCWLGGCI